MKPKVISFALMIAFCFVSVVRKQDALLSTFKDFPASQRPATFTIDQAMEKLKKGLGD